MSGSPNDVALLKLEQPVTFDEKMSPVCLPETDDFEFLEKECYITGWGLTKGKQTEREREREKERERDRER